MEERNNDQKLTNAKVLNKRLDAVGWGLFFVWAGIAFITHVGWGVGLLGVGIIILGTQVTRNYFGLKLEGFWVAVGFIFFLGGVCKLVDIRLGLMPILCIVAGVVLFISALVGKAKNRTGDQNHTQLEIREERL